MSVIQVEQLTKDYGGNKGVFDVTFAIEKGEVFGFLGPNGAGKTTTIRHILGFSKPDRGRTSVDRLDSWKQPEQIQKKLGYLAGEIAFPLDMTGTQFLRFMAELRGVKDMGRAEKLIQRFDLDPRGALKRMSKGMKQKVGIVCAFMHDPDILVLDEPTSGLDPLMQSAFIDLVAEEKERGKTILMSSHMFEEVEKTCDRIGIIKQGRLVTVLDSEQIRHARKKQFKLEFITREDCERFHGETLQFAGFSPEKCQARVVVRDEEVNAFIRILSGYRLKFLTEVKQTLEDYFMHFYGGDGHVQ